MFGKHGWTDEPIGPHPCGQFEVVFHRKAFVDFVEWLAHERHPSINILIHPLSPDFISDHTTRAVWLGQPMELRPQPFVEIASMTAEERLRLSAQNLSEVPGRILRDPDSTQMFWRLVPIEWQNGFDLGRCIWVRFQTNK